MASIRVPQRLRIIAWRARRPLLIILLAWAALAILAEFRKPPATHVPVLVAATDLPAGTELSAKNTLVQHLPNDIVPTGSPVSLSDVTGRTTAIAVPAGLPLVASTLDRPIGGMSVAPGLTVSAVTLTDQSFASLLSPGDRLDLFVGEALVAERALVVQTVQAGSSGMFGKTPTVVLVVATTPTQATGLATAKAHGEVFAVLVP